MIEKKYVVDFLIVKAANEKTLINQIIEMMVICSIEVIIDLIMMNEVQLDIFIVRRLQNVIEMSD
jgi:hypothetical protein